jgi:hypothetical protein
VGASAIGTERIAFEQTKHLPQPGFATDPRRGTLDRRGGVVDQPMIEPDLGGAIGRRGIVGALVETAKQRGELGAGIGHSPLVPRAPRKKKGRPLPDLPFF